MKKQYLLLLVFLLVISVCLAQRTISITIDDVPNTSTHQKNKFQSKLLNQIDSLGIPAAIFINENLIFKTDSIVQNFALLNDWAKHKNITLGNHTFHHPRYSEVGLDSFQYEIEKGANLTAALAKKYKKPLRYFRFPYNDMGKDSLEHDAIKSYLKTKGYMIAPFTVESSDWMFNYLYEGYLEKKELEEANRIGELYIKMTLEVFEFFDSLSITQYDNSIPQIYLCHDNILNAHYFPELIQSLKKRGYTFVSLENALTHRVYHQPDVYFKKWGVSWFYRWMKNHKERIRLMRQEPEFKKILEEYEEAVSNSK